MWQVNAIMTRFYQRTVGTLFSLAAVPAGYHFCSHWSPFLSLWPYCEETLRLQCVLLLNFHRRPSGRLPSAQFDSWITDTSLPFNKFISSRPSLLSVFFFRSPYFLFFSVVQPWSLCADSNAKLALPPAVSSIDLLLLGREWQAVRKKVKWRNVTARRFGGVKSC